MARDHLSVKRPAPRRGGILPIILWFLPIPLMFYAASSVALIVMGMLPTFVAALVDRREEKYTAYTVGGFNLCGILPFLAILWNRPDGNRMPALTAVISNPLTWLCIYGAAALGWGAFRGVPALVIHLSGLRDRRDLAAMIRRQEQLIEEWGPEICGSKDPP